MAAQEYYTGNIPTSGQSQASAPPPSAPPPAQNPRPQMQSIPTRPLPYPLEDYPPPPYSPGGEQRPQSQPPPRRPVSSAPPQQPQRQRPPPQQRNYESQFRPPVRQHHTYEYPNEKSGGQQPSYNQPPYQPQQPYQQPYYGGAPQPVQNLYMNGGYPNGGAPTYAPGRPQYRYDSPSRSRSRSRSGSRSRGVQRRHPQRKKSHGINTFLGAGGGAIIGDAIFPGLGTIGGAILGGFGGHEYGKKRPGSHDGRRRERRYSDNDDRRGRKY